jgi:hypothetical protein
MDYPQMPIECFLNQNFKKQKIIGEIILGIKKKIGALFSLCELQLYFLDLATPQLLLWKRVS